LRYVIKILKLALLKSLFFVVYAIVQEIIEFTFYWRYTF